MPELPKNLPKKLVKTTKDDLICPAGHICHLTKQPYKVSNDKDMFLCKICDARGKFEDGAYVCKKCQYAVHEKCPKTEFKCKICHKRNCQKGRSVCA